MNIRTKSLPAPCSPRISLSATSFTTPSAPVTSARQTSAMPPDAIGSTSWYLPKRLTEGDCSRGRAPGRRARGAPRRAPPAPGAESSHRGRYRARRRAHARSSGSARSAPAPRPPEPQPPPAAGEAAAPSATAPVSAPGPPAAGPAAGACPPRSSTMRAAIRARASSSFSRRDVGRPRVREDLARDLPRQLGIARVGEAPSGTRSPPCPRGSSSRGSRPPGCRSGRRCAPACPGRRACRRRSRRSPTGSTHGSARKALPVSQYSSPLARSRKDIHSMARFRDGRGVDHVARPAGEVVIALGGRADVHRAAAAVAHAALVEPELLGGPRARGSRRSGARWSPANSVARPVVHPVHHRHHDVDVLVATP